MAKSYKTCELVCRTEFTKVRDLGRIGGVLGTKVKEINTMVVDVVLDIACMNPINSIKNHNTSLKWEKKHKGKIPLYHTHKKLSRKYVECLY